MVYLATYKTGKREIEVHIVELGPSPSQKNKTFVLDQSRKLKSPSNHHPPPPPKTFKEVPGKLEA